MKYLLVIQESKNFSLKKKKKNDLGWPVILQLSKQARKPGEMPLEFRMGWD